MTPTKDITKVRIGVADLYFAPADTAQPADTVEYQGTFTTWAHPGFTDEGTTLHLEKDIEKHYVEEQSTPALITVNTTDVMVEADLAEDTMANIKLALGSGAITTVAAATGIIGKETYTLSDDLTVYAMLMETKNPQGFFRRLYIPRGIIVGSVEPSFRRSDGKVVYHLEFNSISATNTITITNKTAAALP